MKFRSCWVCFLPFLILIVRGSWLDGNDGVDRYSGDLPGQPSSMNATAQPKDCAVQCKGNSACKAWAYVKANCEGSNKVPLCYQKKVINPQSKNKCVVSGLPQEPSLTPLKYIPFPVGAIRPEGWLLDVLRTQADGLSGNLDEFWPLVNQSVWIGGNSDSGLHEDTPYWLNGFLPLSYQLNNSSLIKSADKYVTYILDHQLDNGWLGPDDSAKDGNQYWSRYNMLNILRQYHEANPQETRAVPAMLKFLKEMYQRMFDVPLGGGWSAARWQDLVPSIHWMLERYPSGQKQMLWDMAELVQQQGFKWNDWYGSTGGMTFPTDAVSGATMFTHGVNNGMAIKTAAVWSRQSHNQSDVEAAYQCVKVLDQYHGQANGIFACDEHLAGTMPSRGTELCTVVEAMYSYETMFNILGDEMFAERAEKLAYNALPATLTPDMWAHQYLQQVNQMQSMSLPDHVWTHDGPDSTVFGLAPNYVCCTANFNQGWPKFTQHVMSMLPSGDGVAISMYAPANLSYTLPNGVSTTVMVMTDYPFAGEVNITASCGSGMSLSLRVPRWAVGPSITVNQTDSNPSGVPSPGTMYSLKCSGTTNVSLSLPMAIKIQRRFNNAAAVYYGPLLFALGLQDKDEVTHTYYKGSKDFTMTSTTPWNYALYLPVDSTPDKYLDISSSGVKRGISPFSLTQSPLKMAAKGKKLDSWSLVHNAPDGPPQSPVQSSESMDDLTLVPYGATNLRMGEMPVLDDK